MRIDAIRLGGANGANDAIGAIEGSYANRVRQSAVSYFCLYDVVVGVDGAATTLA